MSIKLKCRLLSASGTGEGLRFCLPCMLAHHGFLGTGRKHSTPGSQTCGNRFVKDITAESLYCTPKTNIILYGNYKYIFLKAATTTKKQCMP